MSRHRHGPEYLSTSSPADAAAGQRPPQAADRPRRRRRRWSPSLSSLSGRRATGRRLASSPRLPAGGGAAGLDDRLLQRRPRPERRARRSRPSRRCASSRRSPTRSTSADRRRPARAASRRSPPPGECDGLDYAADVEPWLGSRAAVAAIDLGEDQPAPVGGDPGQRRGQGRGRRGQGDRRLRAAPPTGSASARLGRRRRLESPRRQEIAQQVVDASDEGTLADDASFPQWTGEARRRRRRRLYVAHEAARYLADRSTGGRAWARSRSRPPGLGGTARTRRSAVDPSGELARSSRAFHGHGGHRALHRCGRDRRRLQVNLTALTASSSDAAGTVVAGLPADTAAAFGLALKKGWRGRPARPARRVRTVPGPRADSCAQFETETGLAPRRRRDPAGRLARPSRSGATRPRPLHRHRRPREIPVGALKATPTGSRRCSTRSVARLAPLAETAGLGQLRATWSRSALGDYRRQLARRRAPRPSPPAPATPDRRRRRLPRSCFPIDHAPRSRRRAARSRGIAPSASAASRPSRPLAVMLVATRLEGDAGHVSVRRAGRHQHSVVSSRLISSRGSICDALVPTSSLGRSCVVSWVTSGCGRPRSPAARGGRCIALSSSRSSRCTIRAGRRCPRPPAAPAARPAERASADSVQERYAGSRGSRRRGTARPAARSAPRGTPSNVARARSATSAGTATSGSGTAATTRPGEVHASLSSPPA